MENRGQEIKISLKDRIAALGLDNQGPATPSSNAFSNTQASFTYGSPATGNSSTPLAGVRDKAARFESIGGVPVPRGSFGLGAPPAQYGPKKSGELYGNRIPSGSRSPGGSPGRSLAEESGDPEFTRIRLRSIKSPDEFKHFEELEVPMAISVIPPTPAFPPPEQVTAPPMETETLSQTPEELSPSIPEDHSPPVLAETTNGTVPELEIPIKASPSTISQELETVPESPNTAPQPAYAKPTIAARRRSAILALEPFTELENGTSSIKEPTTAALPTRSSTLSPGTTARRTRSQASGRGDSISSSSSVFISPPSYQGEISGGGSTSSPTLETMRVSSQSPDNLHAQLVSPFPSSQEIDVTEAALSIIFPDPPHGGTSVANHDSEESPELPTEIITRAPPQISRKDETITEFKSSETGLREVDLANEGVSALIRAEFAAKPLRVHQMSLESASELAYLQSTPPQSLHDHSNVQDDATTLESVHSPVKDVDSPGYRSSSPQSTPSHSQASSELAAETASPARVMRELRQFGMEKQGIIISPPRRASVLSMMLPSPVVTPTDDEPPNRQIRSKRLSLNPHPQSQRNLVHGSASSERGLVSESPRVEFNQTPIRSSSLIASFDMKGNTEDTSPTTASTFSIPPSFSGTSDASHGGPSRSSSPQEVASFAASLGATSFTLPSFTTSLGESPGTSAPLSKSSVPFLRQQTEPSRALTPSPPPSFRSLYSSGRLPPSSRGPGPHPSSKVPLLQRAVSLVSRALPPIPMEDLPRRTSSAFHVIRSRTSSKAKQEKPSADFVRASSSSDATIKDASPRNSSTQSRMRTTSSPLLMRSMSNASSGPPPPVPPLPPVVVVQDSSDSTPIARMFMEQRSQSSRAPPTSYRPGSPTASISSAYGSMSSCGPGPVHLFSPSFDQGIFDAFPEVPDHLPSDSVIARHSKTAGRPRLGLLSSHSYSDLESSTLGVSPPSPSKSEGGSTRLRSTGQGTHGTIKGNAEAGEFDEFGNLKPPARRKSSRKEIPGWVDGEEETETGWANVSVTRSRIA